MPYLFFVCVCLIWGSSFILVDRAAQALGPVDIAMGRLLGGAAVLGVICWAQGASLSVSWRDLRNIVVVAVAANAVPFTILPYVMIQANEHAFFGIMVSLVPLITIVLSVPMLGVRPAPRQMIGVLGGLICLFGMVYDGSQRGIPSFLLGLALLVPTAYAFGNTYIKWKLSHLASLPLTTLFLTFGGLMLLPLWLIPGGLRQVGLDGPVAPHNWPVAIAALVTLFVIGTGLAVLMFIHLVQDQGPLFAAMVTYVIPVLALLWGQYDDETLTPLQIAAMAGVLSMVALVQWRPEAAKTPLAGELQE